MSREKNKMIEDKKILLVGAHPDDLEFGMGATMFGLKHVQALILSDTVNVNGDEVKKDLDASMRYYGFPYTLLREPQTMQFFKFEDVLKNALFAVKKSFSPDIVFCPCTSSVNRDHSITAQSVSNVFQEQSIFMYEVARGDYNFKPNVWYEVSKQAINAKITALGKYTTQKNRSYMDAEAIIGMAKFRGAQIGAEYAECFEARIVV
jgi:LmbE family N-acetylglucosaminyl deacetylase